MTTTDQLHTNIKTILQSAMREQSITYTQLIAATGLDMMILSNAIGYGIVHLCDYVAITRALSLDASAVLAEAVNHQAKKPPTHPPVKTLPAPKTTPESIGQIGVSPLTQTECDALELQHEAAHA